MKNILWKWILWFGAFLCVSRHSQYPADVLHCAVMNDKDERQSEERRQPKAHQERYVVSGHASSSSSSGSPHVRNKKWRSDETTMSVESVSAKNQLDYRWAATIICIYCSRGRFAMVDENGIRIYIYKYILLLLLFNIIIYVYVYVYCILNGNICCRHRKSVYTTDSTKEIGGAGKDRKR